MSTPTELEIKYQCLEDLAPPDIEAVALDPYRLGERTEHDLRDTLLDTPSRAFAQQMVALRLRRDGDRRIVTLKGPKRQEGQALRRDELEVELEDGHESDPATWPEPVREKVVAWSAGEPLQPLFTIRNQRFSWPVYRDQRLVAELTLDRGRIEAAGLIEALHEIEIELKEGDAAEIDEIAGKLAVSLPLRHATRGKAERGFALLLQAVQVLSLPDEDAAPSPGPSDV